MYTLRQAVFFKRARCFAFPRRLAGQTIPSVSGMSFHNHKWPVLPRFVQGFDREDSAEI